jgi:hypothetical protein
MSEAKSRQASAFVILGLVLVAIGLFGYPGAERSGVEWFLVVLGGLGALYGVIVLAVGRARE